MKRLLIAPLILTLSSPVQAEIDKEIAEFCLKATDFAGCVESMSKKEVPFKQKQDSDQGMRTWTRATGVVVRMRTASVKAMRNRNGDFGTHLRWNYSRTGDGNYAGSTWQVEANCKEFTANWKGNMAGWTSVRDPEQLMRKSSIWNDKSSTYEPAIEAKAVLTEFCPEMDRLVLEAKEYEVQNPNSRKVPMACKNGVWDKNHTKSRALVYLLQWTWIK